MVSVKYSDDSLRYEARRIFADLLIELDRYVNCDQVGDMSFT